MIWRFDDVTNSNKHKFRKCCNSESADDIKNALSGIMANDLKFPSIYSVEIIKQ